MYSIQLDVWKSTSIIHIITKICYNLLINWSNFHRFIGSSITATANAKLHHGRPIQVEPSQELLVFHAWIGQAPATKPGKKIADTRPSGCTIQKHGIKWLWDTLSLWQCGNVGCKYTYHRRTKNRSSQFPIWDIASWVMLCIVMCSSTSNFKKGSNNW